MTQFLDYLENDFDDPFASDEEQWFLTPKTKTKKKKKKNTIDKQNQNGHNSNNYNGNNIHEKMFEFNSNQFQSNWEFLKKSNYSNFRTIKQGVVEIWYHSSDAGLEDSFFCWWPKPLIMEVFLYFSELELKTISLVCKDFARIAREPLIWKSLLNRKVDNIESYENSLFKKKEELTENQRNNFWKNSFLQLSSWDQKFGYWTFRYGPPLGKIHDILWIPGTDKTISLSESSFKIVDYHQNKTYPIKVQTGAIPKYPHFLDSSTLVTFSEKYNSLSLLDVNSRKINQFSILNIPENVNDISVGSNRIFTSHKHKWAIWSPSGENLSTTHSVNILDHSLRTINFEPKLNQVAIGSGKDLNFLGSGKNKLKELDNHQGTIRLYDANTATSIRKLVSPSSDIYMGNVDNILFSPENSLLLAQVEENKIFQFDLRSKDFIRWYGKKHSESTLSYDKRTNDKLIFNGPYMGVVFRSVLNLHNFVLHIYDIRKPDFFHEIKSADGFSFDDSKIIYPNRNLYLNSTLWSNLSEHNLGLYTHSYTSRFLIHNSQSICLCVDGNPTLWKFQSSFY